MKKEAGGQGSGQSPCGTPKPEKQGLGTQREERGATVGRADSPLTVLQCGDVEDVAGVVAAAHPGGGSDEDAVARVLAQVGQVGGGGGRGGVQGVGGVPVLHAVQQDGAVGRQRGLPGDVYLAGAQALVRQVKGGAPWDCGGRVRGNMRGQRSPPSTEYSTVRNAV